MLLKSLKERIVKLTNPMYINTEIADKYQEFFNFMNQEHGLILTISEMDEIVTEAQNLVRKFDKEPIIIELKK